MPLATECPSFPTPTRTLSEDSGTALASLDTLARYELAAFEAYQKAVEYVRGGVAARILHAIGAGHHNRASRLRDAIAALGGEPPRGSGQRGVEYRVGITTATLLGAHRTLLALHAIEGDGGRLYEVAHADMAGHNDVADLRKEQARDAFRLASVLAL